MTKTYAEYLAEKNKKTAQNLDLLAKGNLEISNRPMFIRPETAAKQNQTSRENLSLVGTRGPSSYARR